MPAPIHPAAYQEALDIALRAHRALGCRGVSRADLRYDDTGGEPGRMVLLEVNTQPGMTPTSLVPDIAAPCRHQLRRAGALDGGERRHAIPERAPRAAAPAAARAPARRLSAAGSAPRRRRWRGATPSPRRRRTVAERAGASPPRPRPPPARASPRRGQGARLRRRQRRRSKAASASRARRSSTRSASSAARRSSASISAQAKRGSRALPWVRVGRGRAAAARYALRPHRRAPAARLLAAPGQARAGRPTTARSSPTERLERFRRAHRARRRRRAGGRAPRCSTCSPTRADARAACRGRGAGRRPALEPPSRQRHRRRRCPSRTRQSGLAPPRRARPQRAACSGATSSRSTCACPTGWCCALPPEPPKTPAKKGKPAGKEHMTKPRCFARRGSAPVAAVDIGTTKVCCFIARASTTASRASSASATRSRAACKNGVIVDIEAASHSILTAVHAAEQMAGETISEAVVNISGGFGASRLVKAEIASNGREISDHDMRRVLELRLPPQGAGRPRPSSIRSRSASRSTAAAASAIRAACSARSSASTCTSSPPQSRAVRNLTSCIGRCHLEIARAGGEPLRRGARRARRGRERARRHRHRHGRRHHRRSPCSSTATWSSPTACRWAAATSPTTSRAACRRRSPMPSA